MSGEWKVKEEGVYSEVAVVHSSFPYGMKSDGWVCRAKIVLTEGVEYDEDAEGLTAEERREAKADHKAYVRKAGIIARAFNDRGVEP